MAENPFDYLNLANGLIQSNEMRGTAGSSYQLFISIGVVGLLVTLMIIGITLTFSSPAKRAEALDELKWKALIAIVLFSMTTLVSWALNLASSFI